jgi:glycerol-3-phosphate dehydrogenase (NAD(P)+)
VTGEDVTRVAVVGGGSWGTAVAALLAERHDVLLWALEDEVVDGINERAENPLFHPGVTLPDALQATTDLKQAVDGAEVTVMAVPTQYIRGVTTSLAESLDPAVPIVSLSKGIESDTLMRPTQIVADVYGGHDAVGVLSGPNLAREVITGHPAATVLAFADHDLATRLQSVFESPRFDVYTNDDVVGCELGGSVKNVVAVAAGMASGLGHGQNAIAALVCRGLIEMTRLGLAYGARAETFLGLAGQGDLVATCLSDQSRNHHFGRELAKGRTVDEIAADTNMVAEGVKSVDSMLQLADRAGVDMSLVSLVHNVVHGGHPPDAAFEIRRQSRPAHELEGIVALLGTPTAPDRLDDALPTVPTIPPTPNTPNGGST